MKSVEENRLVLRLLAAVSAQDRLSESTPAPEEDALVLLLRAAILEAKGISRPRPTRDANSRKPDP